MAYFTNFQDYLFLSSDLSSEEKQKLDNYLRILEYSGVSRIIAETVTKSIEKGGRPPHNPFRLFSAILFAFSKYSGSLRRIEDSIRFDTRFMYLMEQKFPSYSTISRFCNNIVVVRQREIFSCIMKEMITFEKLHTFWKKKFEKNRSFTILREVHNEWWTYIHL